MARKVATITVQDKGRDKGKVFLLTEMSATQAEKWAARALIALMKSGVEVPEDIMSLGLAGLAVLGVRALGGLPWELAEPLFDEMWTCVVIVPDPARPNVTRRLVEDDIEEIATRLMLRKEIINLHVDFFTSADRSTSAAAPAAASN